MAVWPIMHYAALSYSCSKIRDEDIIKGEPLSSMALPACGRLPSKDLIQTVIFHAMCPTLFPGLCWTH